ncbi:MAG TPA: cupin domain-containing protein [Phycisphaerae bacterium]|nr:cupin domain-containing protein [Phycisphaerae bacterium]
MILKNLATVEAQPVAMQGAKNVRMQLLCGPADGCPTFAMRKFIVAPGGCTPKHHHDYEHEVLILSGQGTVFGNDHEQPLHPGDVLFVPANEPHQFKNTAGPDGAALEFLCLVPAFVHRPGAPAPTAIDCTKDTAAAR